MNTVDRIIVDYIMKWKFSHTVGVPVPNMVVYTNTEGQIKTNFCPTTNLEDAWTLLQKLAAEYNYRMNINYGIDSTEIICKTHTGEDTGLRGEGPTFMEAVCRVALPTVGVDVDDVYTDENLLPVPTRAYFNR